MRAISSPVTAACTAVRRATCMTSDWASNIISSPAEAIKLAGSAQRVAVIGIKTADKALQPAHFVPQYLQQQGVKIYPVPVYYPDVTEILGEPVYRRVADIPDPIDIVDVFRRPDDVLQHVGDIIAAKPAAVWLQTGIRNAQAEDAFAKAGMKVVADRCLKVDRSQAGSGASSAL